MPPELFLVVDAHAVSVAVEVPANSAIAATVPKIPIARRRLTHATELVIVAV